MKNLFALLIGINNYAHIRPLSGCENDVNRVSGFLSKFAEGNFTYHEKRLLSRDATKNTIVNTFKSHLIQADAKAGDVVFLYFSGHGAEEQAHEVFWRTDTNRRIQVLACHDSHLKTGANFLADKELRYLLHKVSGPDVEVITIFDCCHSGDNTRSLPPQNVVERLAGNVPQRAWADFIFSHEISEESIREKTLEVVMPQGRHVQIAACDSHESAYERENDGGFFTKALLEILKKTRGDISYLDLKNQTRNVIRTMSLDAASRPQTPKAYAFSGQANGDGGNKGQDLLFGTFFSGLVKDKPLTAEVYFNRQEKRWEVDKGAIYGVREIWNDVPQQIVVPVSPDKFEQATIIKAYPGFSVVEFEPYADIHEEERYEGVNIPSLMSRALRISVSGEEKGVAVFHSESPESAMADKSLFIVDESQNPEYRILAQGDCYLITLPGDVRPLTEPISGYLPYSVKAVHDVLAKLVKWNFLKHLTNPGITELDRAFDVEVSQEGKDIHGEGNDFVLDLPVLNANGLPAGKYSLTLFNRTGRPLYYGAIYMSTLFDINPNILDGGVQRIDTGVPCFLRENKGVSMEQFVRDFNWKEEMFHVLIVSATSEFSMDPFVQSGVQAPTKKSTEISKGERDILFRGESDSLPELWQTRLFTFHLPNPGYVEQ